jgi:hypothetical protein
MAPVVGLGVMLFLWAVTLRTLAWSWERHLPIAIAAGVEINEELRRLTPSQIAWRNVQRHTLAWTGFFACFFLFLAAIELPLWSRVGIAMVLAAYYGSVRVQRDEAQRERDRQSKSDPLFSPKKDRVWYRGLAISEWFGYLGLIMFAMQILADAVGI